MLVWHNDGNVCPIIWRAAGHSGGSDERTLLIREGGRRSVRTWRDLNRSCPCESVLLRELPGIAAPSRRCGGLNLTKRTKPGNAHTAGRASRREWRGRKRGARARSGVLHTSFVLRVAPHPIGRGATRKHIVCQATSPPGSMLLPRWRHPETKKADCSFIRGSAFKCRVIFRRWPAPP